MLSQPCTVAEKASGLSNPYNTRLCNVYHQSCVYYYSQLAECRFEDY